MVCIPSNTTECTGSMVSFSGEDINQFWSVMTVTSCNWCDIYKNPVKAGMVKEMQDYQWCSYKGYLSYSKKWNWLHKDYIFSMITPKRKGRLKPFIGFMQDDDSKEVTDLFSRNNLPSIFMPESFIAQIKKKYYFNKNDYEIPESKSLAPS